MHVSGRLGAAFADTMVYVKLGAGLVRIAETFSADESAVSFCTASTPIASAAVVAATGITNECTARQFGGAASALERHWRPSMLVGIGAEQNVGRFFGRVYADAEFISLQTTRVSGIPLGPSGTLTGTASQEDMGWTVRFGAMLGLRF